MKFTIEKARGTKDVDFILDVVALRKEPLQLAKVLESLGYKPVPESRNFQFVKDIPGSKETMRIEFMAPEEFKCRADFRSHKHFRLNAAKIKRAQKLLSAGTETEAIERALDLVISEHEKNRLAAEANDRFVKSGMDIQDIYGTLEK